MSNSRLGVSNVTGNSNRRSVDFSPSLWGDHFLSYANMETNSDNTEQHFHQLKEEVKRMIMAPVEKSSQKLNLIDDIQRLCVSYHFENEIDDTLQQIHHDSYDCDDLENDDDLYTAALRFRLFRQQGYNVSCDMFKKFKDGDGKYKESLTADVLGLLSLYEAAHLRIHGEDILDEALTFTTTHLELATHSLSPPLLKQITHALYQPLWRGLPRLEARHYMGIYQEKDSRMEIILTFAKLDFNMLQQVHQRELSDISRWWKDLDFKNKLPFARDRAIECYFWTLGVYFEPQYFLARRTMTKVIAMASTIDDIYDVYGTPEELELFTEAIERWDICAMDKLPKYMKVCYQALLDIYTEIEENLANEGKLYLVDFARKSMKILVRAYFQEAKWLHQNYTPTLDEYMPLALATSGYAMLAATSFVGLGNIVTKESTDWLFSGPKILKASELVARLMDDIAGHKFEQKRGHVASTVECYMKQYGATEEESKTELLRQVDNAWKDTNQECLNPTAVPRPILMRILNLTRVIDVLYKREDIYTHPGTVLKDFITSLLIKPVSM